MSHGYSVTTEPCPDCAKEGVAEWLHSNGVRTLCTNPWCGYDVTREPDLSELPPGTQAMLL